MGTSSSHTLSPEVISTLQDKTGFSPYQIDYLYNYYRSLYRDDDGKIQRSELMRMPQIIVHPLAERIVDAFLYPTNDFEEFITELARFRIVDPHKQHKANSRNEKLKAIFRIYDCDNDGALSAEECKSLLPFFARSEYDKEDLEVRLNEQLTLRNPKCENNGKITLVEWLHIVDGVEFDDFLAINF